MTPDAPVTINVVLPLQVSVSVRPSTSVRVLANMPPMTVLVRQVYVSGAARPTVRSMASEWQIADQIKRSMQDARQAPAPTPAAVAGRYQRALPIGADTAALHGDGSRDVRPSAETSFSDAARVATQDLLARIQDGLRTRRPQQRTGFQRALPLRARSTGVRLQDTLRDRRNWAAGKWQQAVAHSFQHLDASSQGLRFDLRNRTDHQQAMRPHPGLSPRPTIPPGASSCYTPPLGGNVALVFREPWTYSPHLIFACDKPAIEPPAATVVVPIRRVYVVLNQSSLRRVDGDVLLPTFSMSMSLDVDSWTWSFSAALPGHALADIEPNTPGEPVLVEAMVNGVAYRMQIERRARDRSFASNGLRISGRGVAAVLDAPHAPSLNHTNQNARTAQQLMNDILTLNGVSIGWDIDWHAVDWSIPAGVFAHQGTYISALNTIAAAAGSYLQPHRTDQVLRVLPRYPALPWEWADRSPDYEIPSAASTVEGIEWVDKALYNRVFVSGVQSGVLGQVTRAGTDGTLVAPMVTDPLITTAAAARQRATPVLADTGSQAQINLRLPVLSETGVITPGKFVRYTDGGTARIGLSRAVSVDVQNPEIWQTVTLETHV